MNTPLVSVIVPTYNYGNYLPRALDSLLGQYGPRPEIIVVDDGSTDNTEEVLERYRSLILTIRQENAGVSAARNRGISEARGTFIGFLDPDDFYHQQKLERQVALLQSHPACGWTYCDCLFFDEGSGNSSRFSEQYQYASRLALDGAKLFEALIPSNFICPLSLLIRRDYLDKAGGFDTRFAGLEDFDFVLRMSAASLAIYSPEVLATYTWHPGSLGKNQARMSRDKYLILDKISSLYPHRIPTLGLSAKRAVADMHNWFGYYLYHAGETRKAFERLWRSLHLYPFQRRAWLFFAATLFRLLLRA